MRLDFDFNGSARYAAARKEVNLELPEDYQFTFWMRADAPVNNLEFKLVDVKGNVWWVNQRNFDFPHDWQKVTLSKDDFEYAWGPAAAGQPKQISAIEIVVTAWSGGKGTVWVDDLRLEQLAGVSKHAVLTPERR